MSKVKKLPNGCTVYTVYEDTDDGGQIVADFAILRDGTMIMLRERRYPKPVVKLV